MNRNEFARLLAHAISPVLPPGWELLPIRDVPMVERDPIIEEAIQRSFLRVAERPLHPMTEREMRHQVARVQATPPDLLLRGPEGDEFVTLQDVDGAESSSPLVEEAWSVLNDVQDALCHLLREPWPNHSPGEVPDRKVAVSDGKLELWFELEGVDFLRLNPIGLS